MKNSIKTNLRLLIIGCIILIIGYIVLKKLSNKEDFQNNSEIVYAFVNTSFKNRTGTTYNKIFRSCLNSENNCNKALGSNFYGDAYRDLTLDDEVFLVSYTPEKKQAQFPWIDYYFKVRYNTKTRQILPFSSDLPPHYQLPSSPSPSNSPNSSNIINAYIHKDWKNNGTPSRSYKNIYRMCEVNKCRKSNHLGTPLRVFIDNDRQNINHYEPESPSNDYYYIQNYIKVRYNTDTNQILVPSAEFSESDNSVPETTLRNVGELLYYASSPSYYQNTSHTITDCKDYVQAVDFPNDNLYDGVLKNDHKICSDVNLNCGSSNYIGGEYILNEKLCPRTCNQCVDGAVAVVSPTVTLAPTLLNSWCPSPDWSNSIFVKGEWNSKFKGNNSEILTKSHTFEWYNKGDSDLIECLGVITWNADTITLDPITQNRYFNSMETLAPLGGGNVVYWNQFWDEHKAYNDKYKFINKRIINYYSNESWYKHIDDYTIDIDFNKDGTWERFDLWRYHPSGSHLGSKKIEDSNDLKESSTNYQPLLLKNQNDEVLLYLEDIPQ
jgi:hypothetical protein